MDDHEFCRHDSGDARNADEQRDLYKLLHHLRHEIGALRTDSDAQFTALREMLMGTNLTLDDILSAQQEEKDDIKAAGDRIAAKITELETEIANAKNTPIDQTKAAAIIAEIKSENAAITAMAAVPAPTSDGSGGAVSGTGSGSTDGSGSSSSTSGGASGSTGTPTGTPGSTTSGGASGTP